MRRRLRHAPRCRPAGGRAPGLEEDATDVRRLPGDAGGARPRRRDRGDPRPLARAADDRGGRGRGRRLRREAGQRGRGRGPGHGRGGAQARAGRAGRHPAPQHPAPRRGARGDRAVRPPGEGRPGRDPRVLPAGVRHEPARRAAPRDPGLRVLDRPRADAPLQHAPAPDGLARLHGVRQRDGGRHRRPHARHGPVDAGPGRAATGQQRREPLRAAGEGEHQRKPRPPPSTTATCRSSGRTASGAPLPTRGTPGEPRCTATRAASRPRSTATTSSRSGASGPSTAT